MHMTVVSCPVVAEQTHILPHTQETHLLGMFLPQAHSWHYMYTLQLLTCTTHVNRSTSHSSSCAYSTAVQPTSAPYRHRALHIPQSTETHQSGAVGLSSSISRKARSCGSSWNSKRLSAPQRGHAGMLEGTGESLPHSGCLPVPVAYLRMLPGLALVTA